MNRRGTNGYKKQYHILGMQYADLDLIRFIAFVLGVFIVFGIPKLYTELGDRWEAVGRSVRVVKYAEAEKLPYTPTQAEIVSHAPHGDILLRVWTLESSRGKNGFLYCEKQGLRNDFGFNVANKQCFSSLGAELDTVSAWFEKTLQHHSLAESLCIYNEGVNRSDCEYAKNFLGI